MKRLIITSNNEHKMLELESILRDINVDLKVVPLRELDNVPEIIEDGQTFEENATKKVTTIAKIAPNDYILADDSGLKVDALKGMPGIYSARFAGERKSDAANNAKLLYELTDVPDEDRTAQFHCTLVFAAPKKDSLVVAAEWPGHIGRIPRGENGFGYDPLFVPEGSDQTAAELASEEKNKYSHRAQAIEKLRTCWQGWLEGGA